MDEFTSQFESFPDGKIAMTSLNAPAIYDVVSSLSERIPYTVGKTLFTLLSLPTPLGWERMKTAVKQLDNDAATVQRARDHLLELFVHHTRVGEKLIRTYGVKNIPNEAQFYHAVWQAPSKLQIASSEYRKAFPLSVTDGKVLKILEGQGPVLTAVFGIGDSMYFQFCSVRSFRQKVELAKTQFDQVNHDVLDQYAEVYGVLAKRQQCFDTVVVNRKDKTVQLRLDAVDGISVEQQRGAVDAVSTAFDRMASTHFGYPPFSSAPMNYHALLEKLYQATGEGSVFQLGFTAAAKNSSSNNGAKLIRKLNQDLRTDKFHIGGKSGVNSIDPYNIGVTWTRVGQVTHPKLIVPGSVRMIHRSPIRFPELIVRECLNDDDFEFVSSKIKKYS